MAFEDAASVLKSGTVFTNSLGHFGAETRRKHFRPW